MSHHIETNPTVRRMLWLPAGRISRLNGRARLHVTRGLIWLTVDGQLDDHLLGVGERFTLHRGDHAMLQALDATAGLEIVEPAPAGWPRRLLAMLRGVERRLAGATS